MRSIIRWLISPLVKFVTNGPGGEVNFKYGVYDDGTLFIEISDAFGQEWSIVRTPEEFREQARKMIGMADEVEQESPTWRD